MSQKIKAEAVCELCSDIENIEFDHIDPATKSHDLGDYAWWPRHGGFEAMKAELSKCRPLCRKCHQYAGTSLKRRYEHIDDMPNVTKQDKQNRLFRQYRDEKAGYVLELKMRIGACEHCHLSVTPENCRWFHFAHKNAADKLWSVADLVKNTNCFKTAKTKIDKEVVKCLLLCCNRLHATRNPDKCVDGTRGQGPRKGGRAAVPCTHFIPPACSHAWALDLLGLGLTYMPRTRIFAAIAGLSFFTVKNKK